MGQYTDAHNGHQGILYIAYICSTGILGPYGGGATYCVQQTATLAFFCLCISLKYPKSHPRSREEFLNSLIHGIQSWHIKNRQWKIMGFIIPFVCSHWPYNKVLYGQCQLIKFSKKIFIDKIAKNVLKSEKNEIKFVCCTDHITSAILVQKGHGWLNLSEIKTKFMPKTHFKVW